MNRKHMVAGAIIAIAVLLPLGQWVTASHQQAEAYKEDRKVEQQFIAGRKADGQPTVAGSGQWGGGQGRGGRRGWSGRADGGQGGRRGQGRQRMMEQMAKEVGLTPEQVKQIQAVRDSSRPMMSDVFRNPQLTREQKTAAVQQIRQAQQAQIARLLTADQQAKYTAFQDRMRQQRQAWRGAGGGNPEGPGGPQGGSGQGRGEQGGSEQGGPAGGSN